MVNSYYNPKRKKPHDKKKPKKMRLSNHAVRSENENINEASALREARRNVLVKSWRAVKHRYMPGEHTDKYTFFIEDFRGEHILNGPVGDKAFVDRKLKSVCKAIGLDFPEEWFV